MAWQGRSLTVGEACGTIIIFFLAPCCLLLLSSTLRQISGSPCDDGNTTTVPPTVEMTPKLRSLLRTTEKSVAHIIDSNPGDFMDVKDGKPTNRPRQSFDTPHFIIGRSLAPKGLPASKQHPQYWQRVELLIEKGKNEGLELVSSREKRLYA